MFLLLFCILIRSQGPEEVWGSSAPTQKCRATRREICGCKAPWLYPRAPFSQNQHFCSGLQVKKGFGFQATRQKFRVSRAQKNPPPTPLGDPEIVASICLKTMEIRLTETSS